MYGDYIGALQQLGLLAVAFIPLELAFRRRAQGVWRKQSATDLAFYAGQHLLWLGLQFSALVAIAGFLYKTPLASVHPWANGLPWWCKWPLIVITGDILVYWYHRASHSVGFLWQFHRVHHSSLRLDWLAAHREHPIDGFLTQLAMNLPAIVLGVSMEALVWLIIFRGMWAALIHSNVSFRIGVFRYVVGSPSLHQWHHVKAHSTPHNFSNLAPWLDVLFGTFHLPEDDTDFELGLPGDAKAPYWKWIVMPWRPR